jgi:ubiquinone/menaquinone biosynthesis C-methylase UbiE
MYERRMTTQITQRTYDEISSEFALRNAEMPVEVVGAAERFTRLMGSRTRVLDVGCGPGRDLLWMKSHDKMAIGVDLSLGMLRQAKARELCDLAQMNMLYLALRDNSFDGIWCSASLLHLPKHLAPLALVEFHRVLVPKGALFLAVQEGMSEGLEQNPYSSAPLERFFARYQMTELEEILQPSGFQIIERARHLSGSKCWLHLLASVNGKAG